MLPDKDSASGTYGTPYTNAHQVEDPTTDIDAVNVINPVFANVAMMTHTVPRALVKFVGATYSGVGTDSITPTDHDALWGSGVGVQPTIGHGATGVYVITWPSTVTDELGGSHTTNIRFPLQPAVIGSDGLRAKVTAFTANTITVTAYSSGTVNDLNGSTIMVAWI